jgi:hypothetical protein
MRKVVLALGMIVLGAVFGLIVASMAIVGMVIAGGLA